DPEIVRIGDICHVIGQRAEALRVHALADDAVLKRDIVAPLREAEAIPASPFDAAMIKDHIATAGKIDRAFAFVAGDAFAKTHVTNDDILLSAKRRGSAINRNAIAGCGLTENGK